MTKSFKLGLLFVSLHKNLALMSTKMSDTAIIEKLGKRIRSLRIRLEMRQEDLAEESMVAVTRIVMRL